MTRRRATSTATTKFAALIQKTSSDRNVSQRTLATACGVSESTLCKWITKNSFPIHQIPVLCATLGLPYDSAQALTDAEIEVGVRRTYTTRTSKAPETLEEALAEIDTLQDNVRSLMATAAARMSQVFRLLGPGTFFAATTAITPPLILIPQLSVHEAAREERDAYARRYEDYFQSRVSAIKAGAMFVLVMGSKSLFARLQAEYGLEADYSHEEFCLRWEQFRARLVDAIGDRPWVDTHVQRFEADEFPLTGVGRSMSLLGTRDGGLKLRTLIRGRHPAAGGFLLLPPRSPVLDLALLHFVRQPMKTDSVMSEDPVQEEDGHRRQFIDAFLHLSRQGI